MITATDLEYPLIFMQRKKDGCFSVVDSADTLGVTLERAVKRGVPLGWFALDFSGRCHEVVAIEGYQPLESRWRAFLSFTSRLVRANLVFEERPGLTFEETRKAILRAFRSSTTLTGNPRYDEITRGVKSAASFGEIREVLEANRWKPVT